MMKIKVQKILVLLLAVFLTVCFVGCKESTGGGGKGGGVTWFVDAGAAGAQTGKSWTNAFLTIQEAVDDAGKGDRIFVKEGAYASGTTDPVIVMKNGVDIYGGFDGTASKLSRRGDPASFPTVLDGNNSSYHVVIGASRARLDGFFVINGNADGAVIADQVGGGMQNIGVTRLTVKDCFFYDNYALYGGGMINDYGSSLTISNSVFVDNMANGSGGGCLTYMLLRPI